GRSTGANHDQTDRIERSVHWGSGYRPWLEPGDPFASLSTLLHNKGQTHRNGTSNLPLDRRSPRRTPVGHRLPATGGSLSVCDPCSAGVIGRWSGFGVVCATRSPNSSQRATPKTKFNRTGRT